MKIALSADGTDLSARLNPRFGRARHFVMVDSETGRLEVFDNEQNLDLPQGAGIQAGQTIVRNGADVLITGNCGPKAFRVLHKANVQVFVGVDGTLQEALDRFNAGELEPAQEANVQGHWA